MPRRSHGYRPYHNATSLYGWGYNGTSGPKAFNSEPPSEYYGDGLSGDGARKFWDYSKEIQDGAYMGGGTDISETPLNSYGNIVFGGLGIGIDFPLYLTDENLVDKNAANILDDDDGPPLTVVRSHVPIPVRLDDYDDSGERLGRENWVKLQGGTGECLGIKTSGETVHDSGHLYGWGMGSYNGGSSLHASMRFWSCVPEICDSGSSRFLPDSLSDNSSNTPPLYKTYLADSANHIGSEPYGDDHMSPNWIDIACATQGDIESQKWKTYSWYLGIKDGKLYTWGYEPYGKGEEWRDKSKYRMGRVFVVDTGSEPAAWGTISATQPTFTKCFGGIFGAAAIDSDGKLYFMGKSDNFAAGTSAGGRQLVGEFYLPALISTSDGSDGFSWWDSSYYDMVVIQDGNIWQAPRQAKRPHSEWASNLFVQINDDTSLGSTLPTPNAWTQVYTLVKDGGNTEDNYDGYDHNPAAIVALNASGQIWIRNIEDPTGDGESTNQETPTYRNLSEDVLNDGDISDWHQISPLGVTFTKIILNPTNSHRESNNTDKMYQIMGLTDKGELYTTDNTKYHTFPYVDYTSNPDGWNADEHDGKKYPFQGAQPSEHYCPLADDGSIDYEKTTPLELMGFGDQGRNTSSGGSPYTFTKVKPPEDNGDGAWWDQENHYCFVDLGWPMGHPKSNTDFGDYHWALNYKEVDGVQRLSFPPVKDRTNEGPYSRKPPVLSWTNLNIDTSDDNPNIKNGLIDKGEMFGGYQHWKGGEVPSSPSESAFRFGSYVATNEDGSIVAVSAPHYPDNMPYEWNGPWYPAGPVDKGAVYVYQVQGEQYIQLGGTIIWDGEPGDQAGQGPRLALSSHVDAEEIMVAFSTQEMGRSRQVGRTKVFKLNTSTSQWDQVGSDLVGPPSTKEPTGDDSFQLGLSLSNDGLTLAIGYARYTPPPTVLPKRTGLVAVYTWSGSAWVQKGNHIYPGEVNYDYAGWACQLSDDGNIVAIGVPSDAGHEYAYKGSSGKGHFRVYEYNGSSWVARTTVWGPNNTSGLNSGNNRFTNFGYSIATNGDGSIIIVGQTDWNSEHTGVRLEGVHGWGKAHVYGWDGNDYNLIQTFESPDYHTRDNMFGARVAIDRTGDTIAISSYNSNPSIEDGGAGNELGQTFVYKRPASDVDYVLINRNHYSDSSQDMTTVLESDAGRGMGVGLALSRDGLVFVAGVPLSICTAKGCLDDTGARAVIRKLYADFLYPTINFRHPRRALSLARDFLWDGQDAHTFSDGWEDLTTARWSSSLYNKYWGIR